MLTPVNHIDEFLPVIKSSFLSAGTSIDLTKDNLLTLNLCLTDTDRYAMYYAPHNDDMNPDAVILIIGITPGFSQTRIAYQTLLDALQQDPHASAQTLCHLAKVRSRFAGTMRRNLTDMLDQLGLPAYLSIPDSASLFNEHDRLLGTTSLLKYPVFRKHNGQLINYGGSSPSMLGDPYLTSFIRNSFTSELAAMPDLKLIIPLGKAVETAFLTIYPEYQHLVLRGLPHPSGVNAHRGQIFTENRRALEMKLQNNFSNSTDLR